MVRDWKRAVRKFTKHERGMYRVSRKELLVYWKDVIKENKIPQMPLIEIKLEPKKGKISDSLIV